MLFWTLKVIACVTLVAFRYLNLDIWNVTKVAWEVWVKVHRSHVKLKTQRNGKVCLVLQTPSAREVWKNLARPKLHDLTYGEALGTMGEIVSEINPRSRVGHYVR